MTLIVRERAGNYSDDQQLYFHICPQCRDEFFGHKRRHVCKVCDDKNKTVRNDDIASKKSALALAALIVGHKSFPGPTNHTPRDHEFIIAIGKDHHAVVSMMKEDYEALSQILNQHLAWSVVFAEQDKTSL